MLTKDHQDTLTGLSKTCPALSVLSHEIKNHIAASIMNLHLLEKAESESQASTYRARALQSLNDAIAQLRSVQL